MRTGVADPHQAVAVPFGEHHKQGILQCQHGVDIALRSAPAGVVWKEIYLPAEDENPALIKLSGLDRQGQGYLAHVDPETGYVQFEKILPGERILFLKYVADSHYPRERETRRCRFFPPFS